MKFHRPLVEDADMDLGPELRKLRKSKRLKLVQVNQYTGLSISFLSDVERSCTNPSLDTLEKLADCYQILPSYILRRAGY